MSSCGLIHRSASVEICDQAPSIQRKTYCKRACVGTLSAETEQSVRRWVKRYREIEDALRRGAKTARSFADVAGSTVMKQGERDTSIACHVQAYEELVHARSSSMAVEANVTPDGVTRRFLI